MLHGPILTADELLQATEFNRDGDLKRALTAAGIRWFPGKGGRPWTTIDLINQAGGLVSAYAPDAVPAYSPDDV